ncbi:MAG: 16S rRNA (cytidine(1402)-2'-O)-methyltransferase [Pseudohongiellaceae bacterium]
MTTATLYIVATPIGNMGDISTRAREILSTVDLIAAEDTRHSSNLLNQLGINTKLTPYHDFSSKSAAEKILKLLAAGKQIALISDAGTPLIADPGFRLVQAARNKGYPVIPIPGPSALLAALSIAGIPTDRFAFEGFPPDKPTARQQHFTTLKHEQRTLIFYETPHRILNCITDMLKIFGPTRQIFLARELTKKFETHHLGDLATTANWLQTNPNHQRGEFVLILAGNNETNQTNATLQQALNFADTLKQELKDTLPPKQLAALSAQLAGSRKNAVYQALLARKR